MIALLTRRPDLLPSLATAIVGILWGLFWLPLRAFDEAGLDGGWATLVLFALSALILLPAAALRRPKLRSIGLALFITGLFTGSGFAFYATSLLLTEVVRALLLFYLTPVWSTLLEALLLKQRITANRALALALGISGLVVILGLEDGFPLPRNTGDWMGLLAGMAWAYGSLRVYRQHEPAIFESVLCFVIGGGLVAALTLLLPIEGLGAAPSAQTVIGLLPWLLAITVLFVLPFSFLVFWGAARLSPGRVGILLMGEIVVGVASAAILTDEPFGLREVAGTVLVVGAALAEVIQRQTEVSAGPDTVV